MKSLTCKDMGISGCTYMAKGMTEEEAIRNLVNHAAVSHSKEMADMKKRWNDQEMAEAMKKKIKDLPK